MYQNIVNWFIYLRLDKNFNSDESVLIYKGLDGTKPVLGVSNRAGLKPMSSATKTSSKFRYDTFQKGNKKALISLHLCCSRTTKTGFLESRPI